MGRCGRPLVVVSGVGPPAEEAAGVWLVVASWSASVPEFDLLAGAALAAPEPIALRRWWCLAGGDWCLAGQETSLGDLRGVTTKHGS